MSGFADEPSDDIVDDILELENVLWVTLVNLLSLRRRGLDALYYEAVDC
jgi:hypothetical protein